MGKPTPQERRKRKQRAKQEGARVLNATGRELSIAESQRLHDYIAAPKRTICFDDNVSSEIVNQSGEIVALREHFTDVGLAITSTSMTPLADDLEIQYVQQWMGEKKKVMLLKLDMEDRVVAFVILHKTDSDPLREHKMPYVIDYIYSYPKFRNMGNATALIERIKADYECSAFCNTDISCTLFEKCGFSNLGDEFGTPLLRSQPNTTNAKQEHSVEVLSDRDDDAPPRHVQFYLEMMCVESEIMNLYEETFKADPRTQSGNSIFTEDEQIERYAKNLCFWQKLLREYNEIDMSTNSRNPRYVYILNKT